MFKLTFEKSVLFVICLIILLSTYSMFSQYMNLNIIGNKKSNNSVFVATIDSSKTFLRFPTALIVAERYYSENDYNNAKIEYLNTILLDTLSLQQKSYAYFKLAMCSYYLEEYQNAAQSFIKSLEYDKTNSIAYNNASVSIFKSGDFEKAIEYQKKAIDTSPVVEYYYNMSKFYEIKGDYDNSIKYMYLVTKGEQNLTLADPVRVQSKMWKLLGDNKISNYIDDSIIIALKTKDPQNTLIMDEPNMDIKSKDFDVHITGNTVKKVICTYDKVNDPYHLINNILWTVEKEDSLLFKSNRYDFSFTTDSSGIYKVNLKINYKGNKVLEKTAILDIKVKSTETQISTYETTKIVEPKTKYYDYAVYEQVFEKDFRIDDKGVFDRFGVMWRSNNVYTKLMEKDVLDTGGSLYIANKSKKNTGGIELNMTSLIKDKNLYEKEVSLQFYARQITTVKDLNIVIRTDNVSQEIKQNLNFKWKQTTLPICIPKNCSGFTVTLNIQPGDEIKIDGLNIIIID